MFSLESWYPLCQKFNAFYGLFCRDYGIVLWKIQHTLRNRHDPNVRNYWSLSLNKRLTRFILNFGNAEGWKCSLCRKRWQSCSISQATFYVCASTITFSCQGVNYRLDKFNDVEIRRRQTPQTSCWWTLINNFLCLGEACGNFCRFLR